LTSHSPLCRAGPAGPIFTIFGLWFHITDVITRVKFWVDWSRGWGATAPQNPGFPIDFECRSYNSVTH